MKKLLFLIIFFLSIIIPCAYSQEGKIPLLALLNRESGSEGFIAELDLKIIEGNERIYLQTFPMTQESTQASMSFAKKIACDEFEIDCSKKDFLYTITAIPGTIGGPSAGAAASLLTLAVLLQKPIKEKTAITGTINSGGLIGPVGGLDKKIEAAAKNGIKKVLIPFGTAKSKIKDNLTIDLIKFGAELNITVKEVFNLEEAAEIVLGIKKKEKSHIFKIDEKYINKMKNVAELLCNRKDEMKKKYFKTDEKNFTKKAESAFEKEDYYTSASYCFRENFELRKTFFSEKTEEETIKEIEKLKYITKKLREETEKKPIRTITDIETYMAVMERIEETEQLLEYQNQTIEEIKDLAALATERLYSASVWSEFFDISYDTRILDLKDEIKKSCQEKISEAEERYSYVKILYQKDTITGLRETLNNAYFSMEKKDYIMCLYKASKSKADSDLLISLQGINDEIYNKTIELKLNAARKAISRTLSTGSFPIIAYSYYEYAKNLFEFNEPAAAIFAEYALELANIDIYFKEKRNDAITVIKGESAQEIRAKQEKKEETFRIIVTIFLILLIIFIWIFFEITSRKDKKPSANLVRGLRGKKR
jgi:uncharacterized protein